MTGAAFGLLLSVGIGWAGKKGPAPDDWALEPSFSASPETLLAARDAVEDPHEFIDILLQEQVWRFDEEGRRTRIYRLVWVPRTEEAVRLWGGVTAYWRPWREERPEVRARVITDSGEVHELDPSTLTEQTSETESVTIYSTDKELVGPLPQVTVGAVVEQEIVVAGTAELDDGGLSTMFAASWETATLQHIHVRVEAPTSLDLDWMASEPDLPVVDKKKGGVRTIDLMLVDPEPVAEPSNLPPEVMPGRWLAVGIEGDWATVADHYHQMVADRIDPEAVAALTTDDDPSAPVLERVSALTEKVRDNVRYTGLEFDEAAIVPYEPKNTLERGYGDCKDQATVLVSALKKVGLDGHLVLLRPGPGPDIRPEYPSLWGFTHAIVAVPHNGELLWVDPTASGTGPEAIASHLAGRQALVIGMDDVNLTTIPAMDATANTYTDVRSGRLDLQEGGLYTEQHTGTGWLAGWMAGFHSSLSEENRDKVFREYLGWYVEFEEDDQTEIELSTDPKQTPHRQLAVHDTPSMSLSLNGGKLPMGSSPFVDFLPEVMLDPSADALVEREADIALSPHTVSLRWDLALPAGYLPPTLPDYTPEQWGPLSLQRSETWDDGTRQWAAEWTFTVAADRISADDARAFADVLVGEQVPFPDLVVRNAVSEHIEAGELVDAVVLARELTEQYPEHSAYGRALIFALLDAGLVMPARQEARAAVDKRPDDAFAWFTLGAACERSDWNQWRRGPGYDKACAIEAYDKAYSLWDGATGALIRASELRRTSTADSPADRQAAIDGFLKWREVTGITDQDGNWASMLFMEGRHKEVVDTFKDSGDGQVQSVVRAASVMLDGVEAVRKEDRRNGLELRDTAGQWASAAGLLSLSGASKEASEALRLMRTVAQDKRAIDRLVEAIEAREGPAFDKPKKGEPPEAPAWRSLAFVFGVGEVAPADVFSEALTDLYNDTEAGKDYESPEQILESMGGMSPEVLLSIVRGGTKVESAGSDDTGWHVIFDQGARSQHFFVIPAERGRGYRLAANLKPGTVLAYNAWQALEDGNDAAADQWLRWLSELGDPSDDRATGFLRGFEAKGPLDDETRRLAAAAITATISDKSFQDRVAPARAELRAALEAPKAGLESPLAGAAWEVCRIEDDQDLCVRAWEVLLSEEPGNLRRALALVSARTKAGDLATARKELDALLAAVPDNLEVRFQHAVLTRHEGDLEASVAILEDLATRPGGADRGRNELLWYRLFLEDPTPEMMEAAAKLAADREDKSQAVLHTAAAIQAEGGDIDTALRYFSQLEEELGQADPLNSWGFVLGAAAEAMGYPDAARSYYHLVTESDDLASTWRLGERRMEAAGIDGQ